MANTTLVDRIIEAACKEIEKYSLKLLQHYPDDLLVHDRCALEEYAFGGAKIAWMVGHCHTHLVLLGVHPKENYGVTYLTNLANDDRFYEISISPSGSDFTMKEVTREQFVALSKVRVPYTRDGKATGFWLVRDGTRVGTVTSESIGDLCRPAYRSTITPVAGITDQDLSALQMWCQKSVVEAAGTLFVRSYVDIAPPIHMDRAA